VVDWWFSPDISSTNKTDCHDITEKSLKGLLKTITHSSNQNAALWL
jgi:hypothetical protein